MNDEIYKELGLLMQSCVKASQTGKVDASVYYEGHINGVQVRIFYGGWKSGSYPEVDLTHYLSGPCSGGTKGVLEFLRDARKQVRESVNIEAKEAA